MRIAGALQRLPGGAKFTERFVRCERRELRSGFRHAVSLGDRDAERRRVSQERIGCGSTAEQRAAEGGRVGVVVACIEHALEHDGGRRRRS